MGKSPSIFNDVIGPVMRGPSSSHTAASWRTAKMCLEMLQEPLKSAVIDFDKMALGLQIIENKEQLWVLTVDYLV